jgi:tetratricopeptide (TPR) repeat protein
MREKASLPIGLGHDRTAKEFERGLRLAAKGHYREALGCFDKVLSMAPAHLDALNSRGDCLALLGHHERAIADYDKLLGSRPYDVGARNSRACALKSAGRLDEAVTEYDAVLTADPRHAQALHNRGNASLELGLPNEAIRDLRRALSLQPNDPDIQTSLIFALNFDSEATAESLQAERANWAPPIRTSRASIASSASATSAAIFAIRPPLTRSEASSPTTIRRSSRSSAIRTRPRRTISRRIFARARGGGDGPSSSPTGGWRRWFARTGSTFWWTSSAT